MTPLVSIITPCYNASFFIRQTIESVLGQSYINWELLITDDCSTDSSVDIIRNYMNEDSRIFLFTTSKNTGHPSIPRNISISHAKGDIVAFLDSDDLWDSHKLDEQVRFIMDNNYELICSYSRVIKEDGSFAGQILKTKENASYRDMLKNYELISPTIMCTFPIANILLFPTCEKEDYIAWLRITKTGVNIHTTKTVNSSYRICSNSRSRNKIKMILYQWYIYRSVEKLGFFYSIYYLVIYIYKTIVKNYM